MTTSSRPRRDLPANPSEEHLRKQAKRLAKASGVQLAATQRQLAAEYGHRNWAELLRAVAGAARPAEGKGSALTEAAAQADEAAVRALLSRGDPIEGGEGDVDTPLWRVCDGNAPAERRLAVARLLLEAGASPRRLGGSGSTALHAASRRGPLALVELLIRGGGLSWQPDRRGKEALDYARKGTAADRTLIVELLDRPVMRDRRFRAAVGMIHAGDLDGLCRLLDEHPDLLRMRAIEPDCYPQGYFRDPKLFWFIANNPTLMRKVPANIAAIGQAMVARGAAQDDLDYTLELAMSSGHRTEESRQLIATLIGAGAKATPSAIVMTLAHWCLEPVEMLLARGLALTAPIAAALDRRRELAALLADASPQDRQTALGLAVLNRRLEAARLCLDAGADPNHVLPVHRHSVPLHQAAGADNVPMLELLVGRGARIDTRDTLWNSTPLDWAVHDKSARAEAYLRSLEAAS